MLKSLNGVMAAGVILLAACDDGAAPTANTAPPRVTTIRNDYHDRMLKLDALPRDAALRRVIRSAGESCDRVDASAFQQDHANLKMWTARCQRNDYAVFLAANGDVQVRKCVDLVSLGLPACRTAT